MVRLLGWLAVGGLLFLLGPWVLPASLVALLVPAVRRAARPVHPWLTLCGVALVLVLVAGVAWLAPAGRLPLPPGVGVLLAPAYTGRPARPHPIGMSVPQHPSLAPDGRSSMHSDAWASDTYRWAGPLGRAPQVGTTWYGIAECATQAFDSRGRMVAVCGDLRGATLRVIDPATMRPVVSRRLPDRRDVGGKPPWENLCGGTYFYLDDADHAMVATSDRRVREFATSDARGRPSLREVRSFDLTDEVASDDCVIALLPDWSGRVWFVTSQGRVGTLDPGNGPARSIGLGEQIANTMAVDETGVYVVTTHALYKMAARRSGVPTVVWRAAYDRGRERKAGQLTRGSGTTPTILPGHRVAITDNAEPEMHVVFLDAGTGREVCRAPVFSAAGSATENSLVSVGTGVIVENNAGYSSPARTLLGRSTTPGLARVDLHGDRCAVRWTSDEVAPTTVPKVSLATGLLYTYTKPPSAWGVAAWYLTALDARTGRTVFRVRAGLGAAFNNHYAPVTLGPDGSAYVATLMGMVRIRDGSVD